MRGSSVDVDKDGLGRAGGAGDYCMILRGKAFGSLLSCRAGCLALEVGRGSSCYLTAVSSR
jgi:hypothetical protein